MTSTSVILLLTTEQQNRLNLSVMMHLPTQPKSSVAVEEHSAAQRLDVPAKVHLALSPMYLPAVGGRLNDYWCMIRVHVDFFFSFTESRRKQEWWWISADYGVCVHSTKHFSVRHFTLDFPTNSSCSGNTNHIFIVWFSTWCKWCMIHNESKHYISCVNVSIDIQDILL